MNAVFADSFYFFALLNPNDESHGRVRAFSGTFDGLIVRTAWVFTEVADGLSAVRDRPSFLRLYDRFRADPLCKFIAHSAELFDTAVEFHRTRLDKSWSLTDCASFEVMRQQHLIDALTGDRHFTQAGFNAIFSE